MKTCKKCQKTKELSEFSKDKSKKDGLTSQCRLCRKLYQISYVGGSDEIFKEYKKEYYRNYYYEKSKMQNL